MQSPEVLVNTALLNILQHVHRRDMRGEKI